MFTRSARYYDAIYAARGKDYGEEVSLLLRVIETHGGAIGGTLLDVACGTGGHLVFLRDTYEVEGLDVDEAMLAIARGKLPQVPLHQADMANFELGRQYDIVVSLFSSIGYAATLEGLGRTIANMAKHTKPRGLVLAEPWIYPEDFKPGTAHAVFVDQPELKIARMDVGQVKGRISILNFHYMIGEAGGITQFEERHEIGLFTHEEYLSAFEAAGLATAHDIEGVDGRGLYIGSKQ
jgi:SAM-dependent methyltransferase